MTVLFVVMATFSVRDPGGSSAVEDKKQLDFIVEQLTVVVEELTVILH